MPAKKMGGGTIVMISEHFAQSQKYTARVAALELAQARLKFGERAPPSPVSYICDCLSYTDVDIYTTYANMTWKWLTEEKKHPSSRN